MCMPKAPAPPKTPAPAPLVPVVDKAPAPVLNEAVKSDSATAKKKKGTSALRIDMVAPQGGSGLNIN